MDLAAKIKSPIQVSRFEINWSTSKIRSPRASGRVLTYTLRTGSTIWPMCRIQLSLIRTSQIIHTTVIRINVDFPIDFNLHKFFTKNSVQTYPGDT